MINYNPTGTSDKADRTGIEHYPKTCFLMTKLGDGVSDEVEGARAEIESTLKTRGMKIRDAKSIVTGGNLQSKIWHMMLGVPLGIAIIGKPMSRPTYGNIFYELGVMQASGKATLIVTTSAAEVPSDFAGTEYVEYNNQFRQEIKKFMKAYLKLDQYYETVADNLAAGDPLSSIDYLRRAYLINGKKTLQRKAMGLFQNSQFGKRATGNVEHAFNEFWHEHRTA